MEHLETELTWAILDSRRFFDALRTVSAKVHVHSNESEHEFNIWYGRGSNPEDSRRLRISRLHPFTRGRVYNYCVTKKSENKDSKFKTVLEENFYDICFSNPEKALKFFVFAGFTEQFRYERIRRNFHLNGIILSYDTMPLIGDYIEIEGDPESILKTASLLGLEEKDSSNLSYKDLFIKWKTDNPDSSVTGLLWEGDRHFFTKT